MSVLIESFSVTSLLRTEIMPSTIHCDMTSAVTCHSKERSFELNGLPTMDILIEYSVCVLMKSLNMMTQKPVIEVSVAFTLHKKQSYQLIFDFKHSRQLECELKCSMAVTTP